MKRTNVDDEKSPGSNISTIGKLHQNLDSDQQLIIYVYGLVWYSAVFVLHLAHLNSYELKIHSHHWGGAGSRERGRASFRLSPQRFITPLRAYKTLRDVSKL